MEGCIGTLQLYFWIPWSFHRKAENKRAVALVIDLELSLRAGVKGFRYHQGPNNDR